jgi:GrpB-like predicted nucleotidyltransferase (UPF0157 family)
LVHLDRMQFRGKCKAALRAAGAPYLTVDHVGGTAVPGLAAKPVVDVDIVVEARDVDAASRLLVDLGFETRGEQGIAQRWALRPPDGMHAPTPTSPFTGPWDCEITSPSEACCGRTQRFVTSTRP